MYIGTSIALLAIGAILWLAVDFDIAGVDIKMIGIILVVVGIIGLILELAVMAPRRRATTMGTREVIRERDRDVL